MKRGRSPDKQEHTMIYCSKAEKKALTDAAASLIKGIPGARMPVYVFILQAALARAKKLGFKP